MKSSEFVEILKNHRAWLAGRGGVRANLALQDLSGLKMPDLQLSKASLTGANLSDCELRGASLCGADLFGADLQNADLQDAGSRPRRWCS